MLLKSFLSFISFIANVTVEEAPYIICVSACYLKLSLFLNKNKESVFRSRAEKYHSTSYIRARMLGDSTRLNKINDKQNYSRVLLTQSFNGNCSNYFLLNHAVKSVGEAEVRRRTYASNIFPDFIKCFLK